MSDRDASAGADAGPPPLEGEVLRYEDDAGIWSAVKEDGSLWRWVLLSSWLHSWRQFGDSGGSRAALVAALLAARADLDAANTALADTRQLLTEQYGLNDCQHNLLGDMKRQLEAKQGEVDAANGLLREAHGALIVAQTNLAYPGYIGGGYEMVCAVEAKLSAHFAPKTDFAAHPAVEAKGATSTPCHVCGCTCRVCSAGHGGGYHGLGCAVEAKGAGGGE